MTAPSEAGGSHRLIFLVATMAAALWALGGVFAVPGFERGVDPSAMASSRVLISTVILLVVLGFWRPRLLRAPRSALPALVAYGLAMAAVNFTYYVSIERIPVGVTLALQFTAPVMVLAWTSLLRGARHRRGVWIAAGMTLFGAAVTGGAFSSNGSLDTVGVISALGSAACLCAIFLTSEAVGRHSINPVTTVLYGFGVASVAWSFVLPWWLWPVDALSERTAILSVLGVAIFGTLVPFFCNAAAARVLPSSTIGIVTASEPAFGGLFAWLILDQRLTVTQMTGGALIIGGVILVERLTRRQPSAVDTVHSVVTSVD